VAAGLGALLAVLGYYQYQWLGQVGEQERAQMQAGLQRTLDNVHDRFDDEFQRLARSFQVVSSDPDGTAQELKQKLAKWNATAPYPGIVRDIIRRQTDGAGGFDLKRLNPADGVWEAADLPKEAIEQRGWALHWLIAGRRAGRGIAVPPDATYPYPGVTIPLGGISGRIFNFSRAALPVWHPSDELLILLDLDYIEREMAPRLVREQFAGMLSDYRVQITAALDPERVLYSSDANTQPMAPDAQTELRFARPPFEGAVMANTEVPFLSALPIEAVVETAPLEDVVEYAVVADMPFVVRTNAPGNSARWTIAATHRSGSLDAAVRQARFRNMTVAFGILSLLGASVAIVLVSTGRAQRLARQQMEFVSTVSHELRTPLAVICSAGENMADGLVRDSEHLRNYGKLVRNEGRRLSEMVEQTLSFSAAHSGLKRYALTPADVTGIVDSALAALEIPLREGSFTVERRIAENLPPALADVLALSRALQNLIGNAIKYGGGSRWIRISADQSGNQIRIAVEDKGPGIAAADLPHIFEPFFRGRPAIDGQIPGAGLGLSLVREIIKGHAGTVEVRSRAEGGAAFIIHVPIAGAAEANP
jgi:signal transduction histidine kinase